MEDVFQKISQPYLTSVTDEDLPDINVVNTLASVISSELIDKHRINKYKNGTVENGTQSSQSNSDDGSPKYLANCEKYDYVGSPTVEVTFCRHFSTKSITSPTPKRKVRSWGCYEY